MPDVKRLSEAASRRLNHVAGHVCGDFAERMVRLSIDNLLTKKGSEKGCLTGLELHAHGMAIYTWFAHGQLSEAMAWFSTAAWLQMTRLKLVGSLEWNGATDTFAVLDASFTGDQAVRRTIGSVTKRLHRSPERDPLAFVSQQIGLLLQDERELAAQAAEVFFRTFDEEASTSLFVPDIELLHAIHFGTDAQVAQRVQHICKISSHKKRQDLDDGFTRELLSTPATLYLKPCWNVGREIEVEDDLVPLDWMRKADAKVDYFRYPELAPYFREKNEKISVWSAG